MKILSTMTAILAKDVFAIKVKWITLILALLIICGMPLPVTAASEDDSGICSCCGEHLPELKLESPPMTGDKVTILQEQLLLLGLNPGTVDGSFGESTRNAVLVFQILRGMNPTGVVDQDFWHELYQVLEQRGLEDVDPYAETSILIDCGTRTLTVFIGGRFHRQYRVAVGKTETPSPLGDWSIVHRSKDWGSGFGTRWMGLNVPWGIYGIHGTNKPGSIGSFASHGCFRMFNSSVEQLYPLTKIGTKVKVIDSRLPYPPQVPRRVYKSGMSGQNVVFLQWHLQEQGLPIMADGKFGSATEWAVKLFQVRYGLEPTGEFDLKTNDLITSLTQN